MCDLRETDKRHFWHPFTQMQDWCAPDHDPLIMTRGEGPYVFDTEGNRYLDGNSSIWTNIHGHNHPVLNAALREQSEKISHYSTLGFSNEPAIELARELVELFPSDTLTRAFFTDDGSTAIECACRMAIQFRQMTGEPERVEFLAFDGAYHGDTTGAASLGGIGTFQKRFEGMGFRVHQISTVEDLESVDPRKLAGACIEPLIQGANQMRTWPAGMLRTLRDWCNAHDVFLILDEVMTGFGRTGTMFACEQEGVTPDFIALAKGLTGGYLPLAATLTTDRVYEAFLGDYAELKTFFYGHSYSGNPLGCAVARANLRVFREENTLQRLQPQIAHLTQRLVGMKASSPWVKGTRQCGFIAAMDLARPDGQELDWRNQTGARVCVAARKRGLITRPILDTLVLMPPLCTTEDQVDDALTALEESVAEVCETS